MESVRGVANAIFLTIDQPGGLEVFGLQGLETLTLSAVCLCVNVLTH